VIFAPGPLIVAATSPTPRQCVKPKRSVLVHTGIQEQTKRIVSSCFLNLLNPNDSFETSYLLLIKSVHVGCMHPGCSVGILSGGLEQPLLA